jgi:hypothetical protein
MRTASTAGIVLIILGVIVLAYQEFTYTIHGKAVEIGPAHAVKEEQETIPVPPIVGGAAVLGGVALLLGENKSE